MRRHLMDSLVAWKDSRRRKPLILKGARQTGKTWLLQEFGKLQYQSVAYVDLLASSRARAIFDGDYDVRRMISALQVESGTSILPDQTLVILDEVQEAPRALTSLKYLCQDAPQYHIAAAGSYLGIAKHEGDSYPVGKVNTMHLHPLDFLEFLEALDEGQAASALLCDGASGIDQALAGKMEGLLRDYLFVGGMPEAVLDFSETRDYREVRDIHDEILQDYDADFSKHMPTRLLERTRLVWEGLPGQLARESGKFVYGAVRPGARARDFEESIQWLVDYGAAVRVPRASALRMPLAGYRDVSAFKLFCVDVGLLGALAHTPVEAVLDGTRLFTEFKGAIAEQYVCQQLVARGETPFYWSSDTGRAELDFAVERGGVPVGIEVKAAENLQAKSLKVARDKFGLDLCVRTSLSGFRDEGWLVNVPLWSIGVLDETLSRR